MKRLPSGAPEGRSHQPLACARGGSGELHRRVLWHNSMASPCGMQCAAEGATIVYPPADMPYAFASTARDLEGRLWSFMERLR